MSLTSPSIPPFASSGVSMKPGPTAVQLMPCAAYSFAICFVRPTTPCLAAT